MSDVTPSTLAGIEEAIEAFLKKQVLPWSAREMAEAIADHLSAARRGLDADASADDVGHARRDLQYVDGLDAHMDEGGTCSARNARDLIAMVRWNAGKFLALIPTERGESGR